MKTDTLIEVELNFSQLSHSKLLISTIKRIITFSKIVCKNSMVKYAQLLSFVTLIIKRNAGQEKMQKWTIVKVKVGCNMYSSFRSYVVSILRGI